MSWLENADTERKLPTHIRHDAPASVPYPVTGEWTMPPLPKLHFNIEVLYYAGFLTTDQEIPGSIPGAIRFSEK
jgi:hypothetical protein